MKTIKIFVYLIILPIVGQCQKCFPFEIDIKPASSLVIDNDIIINVEITPKFKCDTIEVNLTSYGNIKIKNNSSWRDYLKSRSKFFYSFPVQIPSNDTVGFEIKASSNRIWHHAFLYFVTTGNIIQTFPGNPRYNPKISSNIFPIKTEYNGKNISDNDSEADKTQEQREGSEISTSNDNDSKKIFKNVDQPNLNSCVDTIHKFTNEEKKIK